MKSVFLTLIPDGSLSFGSLKMDNSRTPTNVFVLTRIVPGRTDNSAIENYTKGYCQGFVESGLNVRFLQLAAKNAVSDESPFFYGFAKIRLLQFLIDFVRSLYFSISFMLRRDKCVLFVNNVARVDLPILWIFRLLRYRCIIWVTDDYPERREFTRSVVKKYADHAVAINQYIAQDIKAPRDVHVFRGGGCGEYPTAINQPKSGTPFSLFYAGKLNKLNAIDTILEIVSTSPETLSLALFGDGPLLQTAQDYARHYPNIIVHGLKERTIVLDEMRQADAVLSVRTLEDDYYKGFFPSKLIEMLESPCQLIVTDMGLVTSGFENVAHLVDGSDVGSIKAALKAAQTLSTEDAKTLSDNRRILLAREFQWRLLADIVKNAGART